MVEYKTRSERHQKIQKNHQQFSVKTVVPLVGAGLAVAPCGIALQPVTAEASELQAQSGYSANGLIQQIAPAASQIAAANDLYASVMIAQAMVESGNGSSSLSQAPYYNLFGIKGSYNGQTVYLPTQEYLEGQWVTMNEPFRQYSSYWESMQDHANLLRSASFVAGSYHYAGTWKSNTSGYWDATAYLTGRYATDPSYGAKLNYLIEAYGLTQYDTPASGYSYGYQETQTAAVTETAYYGTDTTTQATTATQTVSYGQSYTVVSGDTLWDIAARYGTTVDQLMATNGLSTDTIMVGQTLTV